MNRDLPFSSNGQALLVKPYLKLCKDSPDLHLKESDTKGLLTLADRLHFIFESNNELKKGTKLGEKIADQKIDDLLASLENWLHAILRLLRPKLIAKWKKTNKRYNLYDSLRDLSLLNQTELEYDYAEKDQIKCKVKRSILAAKELRNSEVHDSEDFDDEQKLDIRNGVAASIMLTLFMHEQELRKITRRLVLPPIELDSSRRLCHVIQQEREHHLNCFNGRGEWFETLDEFVHSAQVDQPAQILIVHGPQGQGKSALMSKWSSLNALKIDPIWHSSTTVLERFKESHPWLPGCLLHFGKASKSKMTIAQSLFYQASTLLTQIPNLPVSTQKLQNSLTPNHHQYLTHTHEHKTTADLSSMINLNIELGSANYITTEQYRFALNEILSCVVSEYGPITIIIDAVDEILATSAEGLDTLPTLWPNGVSIIFTVRDGPHLSTLLQRYNRAITKSLDVLSEDDFTAILNLDPLEAEVQITKLYQGTSGWAPSVRRLWQKLQNGSKIDELTVEQPKDVFNQMASLWEDDLDDLCLLLALLEPCVGLSIQNLQSWWKFTYKEHVRAPKLRRILEPVSEQLTSLDGREANIRLVLNAFADHVRQAIYVEDDLKQGLENILEWLSETLPLNEDLLLSPIIYWQQHLKAGLDLSSGSATQKWFKRIILEDLNPIGNQSFIELILKRLQDEAKAVYLAGIKECARLGLSNAMYQLGIRLIEGRDLEQSQSEGYIWLKKSAEQDYLPALHSLGSILIVGIGLQVDLNEGVTWLEKAIELGSDWALVYLGGQLITGEILPTDSERGLHLLNRAAENGYTLGMHLLGINLLEGTHTLTNPEKGLKWLTKAAQNEYLSSMHELGVRLLEGNGTAINTDEGLYWLNKSAESGNVDSMLELGFKLQLGQGLELNINESLKWFKKATASDSAIGMLMYGLLSSIYRASHSNQNWTSLISTGIKKLQDQSNHNPNIMPILDRFSSLGEAFQQGNSLDILEVSGEFFSLLSTKHDLPNHLSEKHDELQWSKKCIEILKQKTPQSTEKYDKLDWYEFAVKNNFIEGMNIIGTFLMTGEEIEANYEEGLWWITKAADHGYTQSMATLAQKYLSGSESERNELEGMNWLQTAARHGEPRSIVELGMRYIKGNGIAPNYQEGIKWLQEGIRLGEPQGMYELAQLLLNDRENQDNVNEGLSLLLRAAQADHRDSMRQISQEFLSGKTVPQNTEEGIKWLLKASEHGDANCMFWLSTYQMYGIYVVQDISKSIEWFVKAWLANPTHVLVNIRIHLSSKVIGDDQANAGRYFKLLSNIRDKSSTDDDPRHAQFREGLRLLSNGDQDLGLNMLENSLQELGVELT